MKSLNTFAHRKIVMSILDVFIYEVIIKFGFPVVLILLFSRGLLIGKMIPSITLISTYLILSGYTNVNAIIAICCITALSTTIGELIIFSQSKNPNENISAYLPDKIKNILQNNQRNPKISNISSKFSNNIGLTIFITNLTMGLRGLSSIPAGKSQYSTYKFLLFSYTSNLLYHIGFTYIFIIGFKIIF
jgi:membrane protein DedA with SNARE-associated domain